MVFPSEVHFWRGRVRMTRPKRRQMRNEVEQSRQL